MELARHPSTSQGPQRDKGLLQAEPRLAPCSLGSISISQMSNKLRLANKVRQRVPGGPEIRRRGVLSIWLSPKSRSAILAWGFMTNEEQEPRAGKNKPWPGAVGQAWTCPLFPRYRWSMVPLFSRKQMQGTSGTVCWPSHQVELWQGQTVGQLELGLSGG